MKLTLSILFMALCLSCGNKNLSVAESSTLNPPPVTMEYAMTRAIEDFLMLVKKEQGINIDSLYFGKHQYGQADDFPDVTLPVKIGGCVIKLITMAEAEQHQREFPQSYFINLIPSLDQNKAEFIFITFYEGFKHQFDYTLSYSIDNNQFKFLERQFKDYRSTGPLSSTLSPCIQPNPNRQFCL